MGSRAARESRRADAGQPRERRAVAQRGRHPAAHPGPARHDDRPAVGRRPDRRVRRGLGRADALPGPVGARSGAPVARLHHPGPGHRGRAHARHREHRLAGARLPVVDRRLQRVLLHAAPGAGLLAGVRGRARAALPLRRARRRRQPRARARRRRADLLPRRRRGGGRARAAGRRHPPGPRARGRAAPHGRGAVLAAARGDRGRRRLAADRHLRARLAGRRAPAGRRLRRHRPLPRRRPGHRPRPLDA